MMNEPVFPRDSLVLFKKRPARVIENEARLEIQPKRGSPLKVRSKDILLIHPGPLKDLDQLHPQTGDVELAWRILLEESTAVNLHELSELIYGAYTPNTAWSAWELVEDGLYFEGEPSSIFSRSESQVEKEKKARQGKARAEQLWSDFLQRLRTGEIDPAADAHFFRDTEDLAIGRREHSRLMQEMGRSQRPASAHAALLEWGIWEVQTNPYPARLGVPTAAPTLSWPNYSDEPRLDLTDLQAYAIDDRENQDPDDAISLIACQFTIDGRFESGRLWVHVADPASLVNPDSELDLEARARGATFYLPEGAVPMLPPRAVEQLALGLNKVSPALSFEVEIDSSLSPNLVRLEPSLVRVERLNYEEVEQRFDTEPFRSLLRLTQAFKERRNENGALAIDLPETMIRVREGRVDIRPVRRLNSREMVREAMLIAGEAAARYANQQGFALPYTFQESPDFPDSLPAHLRPPIGLATISGRFAIRRFMKRSQTASFPATHAGLGLPLYCRSTSPLRRYHDLLAHQQLRRLIKGERPLDEQILLRHLAAAEEPALRISQAESLAHRHWTLVYLLQNPDWQGEGVLVEKEGPRGHILIPELALETSIQLSSEIPLDASIPLSLRNVNLPELEARFTIRSWSVDGTAFQH